MPLTRATTHTIVKLLSLEFLQLQMHTLSMVSERKRQKGEAEGEKGKEKEKCHNRLHNFLC